MLLGILIINNFFEHYNNLIYIYNIIILYYNIILGILYYIIMLNRNHMISWREIALIFKFKFSNKTIFFNSNNLIKFIF